MKNRTLNSRGFTLIELLVTMGIFLMLTGAVLANYRSFNTHATFANSVESLVFALRQAQVYGTGTKGSTIICPPVTGSPFNCAYGVHIPRTAPYAYKIFVDLNGNNKYDAGEDPDPSWTTVWDNSKQLYCGVIGNPCAGDIVDVTFRRPSPDAYITDSLGDSYDLASITINSNTTTDTVTIMIRSTGQISVQ